jgi:hypothetical protein
VNNWRRPNKPELDAVKVPTDIDIAWAAGIFEGEGHCRLCGPVKTNRGFMVSVVQKDPELLYRLRDWFGGSVRDNGAKVDCNTWDCCGDRGRLFITLVYKFMTARRKSQIDATKAMEYLGGKSPESLNILQLKDLLQEYYVNTSRKKLQVSRLRTMGVNAHLIDDPIALEELLKRTTHYSKNMTPEERESYSQVQKERYQRRKKKLQIVEMKKLA